MQYCITNFLVHEILCVSMFVYVCMYICIHITHMDIPFHFWLSFLKLCLHKFGSVFQQISLEIPCVLKPIDIESIWYWVVSFCNLAKNLCPHALLWLQADSKHWELYNEWASLCGNCFCLKMWFGVCT